MSTSCPSRPSITIWRQANKCQSHVRHLTERFSCNNCGGLRGQKSKVDSCLACLRLCASNSFFLRDTVTVKNFPFADCACAFSSCCATLCCCKTAFKPCVATKTRRMPAGTLPTPSSHQVGPQECHCSQVGDSGCNLAFIRVTHSHSVHVPA